MRIGCRSYYCGHGFTLLYLSYQASHLLQISAQTYSRKTLGKSLTMRVLVWHGLMYFPYWLTRWFILLPNRLTLLIIFILVNLALACHQIDRLNNLITSHFPRVKDMINYMKLVTLWLRTRCDEKWNDEFRLRQLTY